MKRLIIMWISIFMCLMYGVAQTSLNAVSQNIDTVGVYINYQAVARGSDGKILANQHLKVRFGILKGSTDGPLDWEEVHDINTTEFGVFTLKIGKGERNKGASIVFKDIDWTGTHYLKTDIDFGSGYIEMSNAPMAWVPYALYALNAGNGGGSSVITYNEATYKLYQNGNEVANLSALKDNLANAQSLSINGQQLSITGANQVTLPIQTLSVEQNTLKLSNGGGSVTVDPSPLNEIQYLKRDSDNLILSHGEVVDSKFSLPDLYEESDTFYIKDFPKPRKISLRNQLSISDNQLSINRGNTVTVDGDPTNEIQDLSLTDNSLKITKNNQATTIDLSKYLDNTDTDRQSISRVGNEIQISGNPSAVDISDMVNVPWVGFSCFNNAGLALPGLNETVISWNKDFDDGNSVNNNVFVAPSSGVYSINLTFTIPAYNNMIVRVYKGLGIYRSFDLFNAYFTSNLLIKLNAGETLSIAVYNSTNFSQTMNNAYFTGYRVH